VDPGGAHVRGVPGRGLPLAELVGSGLEATGTWDSGGAPAWASSCHAAVVRLDTETGAVGLERYVLAHDSGRLINPLLVEGQLHGGFAHGLGYALYEEALHSSEGVFLSPSFLDYTVASPSEMRCEPELIHVETPSSQNPEGFRGVGEAGTIAVPGAIAGAVEDALYALGHEVAVEQIPITPPRLLALLNSR
jgi:aerobic carbon-monoxide dehydrogenase large subunit